MSTPKNPETEIPCTDSDPLPFEQPIETPERWYSKVLRHLGFSPVGIITSLRNLLTRVWKLTLYGFAIAGLVTLIGAIIPPAATEVSTHALAKAPDIDQCAFLSQSQSSALLSNYFGSIGQVYQYPGFNSSPVGGNLPNCSYTSTDSPNDALMYKQPLLQVWATYDPQMITYQAETKTVCGDNALRCENLDTTQQPELSGAARAFISYPSGTTQGLGMICFMLDGYTVRVSAIPGTQDMLLQAAKTVIMNMDPSLPAPPLAS